MEESKINGELSNLPNSHEASSPVHEKLDEFLSLLADSQPDNKTLQELQQKFNEALRSAADSTALQPYIKSPRERGDEDFSQLLFINQVDERSYKRKSLGLLLTKVVRLVISLLLILLGFGMIIMPAPPYFEMFTLFYLNPNDGVTIMDVISLIVAFTGVYLLISTITRLRGK